MSFWAALWRRISKIISETLRYTQGDTTEDEVMFKRRFSCLQQNANLVSIPVNCIQDTTPKQQREAALCRSIKPQLMTCKALTAPRGYLHCKRREIFIPALETQHRMWLR